MGRHAGPEYGKVGLAFIFFDTLAFALGIYSERISAETHELENVFYILCGSGVPVTILLYFIPTLFTSLKVKILGTFLDIVFCLSYGVALISVSTLYITETKNLESGTCSQRLDCQEYGTKIGAGSVAIMNGIFHVGLALGLIVAICLALKEDDQTETPSPDDD